MTSLTAATQQRPSEHCKHEATSLSFGTIYVKITCYESIKGQNGKLQTGNGAHLLTSDGASVYFSTLEECAAPYQSNELWKQYVRWY